MTAAAPVPAANAGKTLGIVGLILSFFSGPIGIVVSAIARSQSKKAGLKNGPAVAGIIIGILTTVGFILAIVIPIVLIGSQCAQLGPGEHVSEDGITTITCGG